MVLLLFASLIWAFSFGLIKGRLAGLDSGFISAARLGLALLVFLPFLRLRALPARTVARLVAIGAVQFGLMYLAYNESFRYLRGLDVALFTITTPIYVTLFADALERRFHWRAFLAAILAVAGASLVVPKVSETLLGIALVQISNVAFAVGQVLYARLAREAPLRDRDVFALLYAGATAVAVAVIACRGIAATPSAAQIWTLVYLGVIASGIGFFLWNVGATRVSAGVLAVMNNAKIPLAVTVSILVFGERAQLSALLASLVVMTGAVWLAGKK